jgi:hypothetical protein
VEAAAEGTPQLTFVDMMRQGRPSALERVEWGLTGVQTFVRGCGATAGAVPVPSSNPATLTDDKVVYDADIQLLAAREDGARQQ